MSRRLGGGGRADRRRASTGQRRPPAATGIRLGRPGPNPKRRSVRRPSLLLLLSSSSIFSDFPAARFKASSPPQASYARHNSTSQILPAQDFLQRSATARAHVLTPTHEAMISLWKRIAPLPAAQAAAAELLGFHCRHRAPRVNAPRSCATPAGEHDVQQQLVASFNLPATI